MLRLDAEEETSCERSHIADARDPGLVAGRGRLEVPVGEEDQPPENGEPQPGEEEVHGEHQEGPPPLGVHQSGEDVLTTTVFLATLITLIKLIF